MQKRNNIIVLSNYWFICIMALFTLLVLVGYSSAATYYVSTSGSDSNACINTGFNACATINGALNKATDGDTIDIEPGNYTLSSVIYIDGFNGLTIKAYNQSNKPVITKTSEGFFRIGKTSASNNVEISYLVLDNGTRRTSYWYGIIRIDSGNGMHIHHNEIRDGWMGIEIQGGHSHEIDNNLLYNFGTVGRSPESGSGFGIADAGSQASGWNEKIYIHHNDISDAGGDSYQCQNTVGNYIEIAYNDMYGNGEDSIDIKYCSNIKIHHNKMHDNAGDGFVGHSNQPANNIEMYSNAIYNNGWWGLFLGGVSSLTVYNNLIYNNAKSITYDTYNTYGVSGGSGYFYNNVVYDNGTTNGTKNHGGYTSSMITINNVFYNNGGSKGNIYSGAGGTINNNYVYPTSPGITGSNAITSPNPGFVNAASGNFNLQSTSPLIDIGIDVGITTDFQDNVRPAGGGFDVGAYEFGGASGDYVAPDPPTNFQVVLN